MTQTDSLVQSPINKSTLGSRAARIARLRLIKQNQAREMASASLADLSTEALIGELKRRMDCAQKPDKHIIMLVSCDGRARGRRAAPSLAAAVPSPSRSPARSISLDLLTSLAPRPANKTYAYTTGPPGLRQGHPVPGHQGRALPVPPGDRRPASRGRRGQIGARPQGKGGDGWRRSRVGRPGGRLDRRGARQARVRARVCAGECFLVGRLVGWSVGRNQLQHGASRPPFLACPSADESHHPQQKQNEKTKQNRTASRARSSRRRPSTPCWTRAAST